MRRKGGIWPPSPRGCKHVASCCCTRTALAITLFCAFLVVHVHIYVPHIHANGLYATAAHGMFPQIQNVSAPLSASRICSLTAEQTADQFLSPESVFEVSEFEAVQQGINTVWSGRIFPGSDLCCTPGASADDRLCGGRSFFSVLVQGEGTLSAASVVNVNEQALREGKGNSTIPLSASWVIEFALPSMPGEYTIKTYIDNFHFRSIYQDFKAMGQSAAFAYIDRIARNGIIRPTRRLLSRGGVQKIVQPDSSSIPGRPQTCFEQPTAGKHELWGYWNFTHESEPPTFSTFCGKAVTKDILADARHRLNGKWIMFVGDSNVRAIYQGLASRRMLKVTLTPLGEFRSTFYVNHLLVSYVKWYPDLPTLHFLNSTASEYLTPLNEAGKIKIPNTNETAELFAKKQPDFVVLCVGAHNPFDPNAAPLKTAELLSAQGVAPQRDASGKCADTRFLFMTSFATDSVKLSSMQKLRQISVFQNNPRLALQNDVAKRIFDGCTFVDGFYPTLPLSTAGLFRDAAHPQNYAHEVLGLVILDALMQ